jgi:hypothetical protein
MGANDGTLNRKQFAPYLKIFHHKFHFSSFCHGYMFFKCIVHCIDKFMQCHRNIKLSYWKQFTTNKKFDTICQLVNNSKNLYVLKNYILMLGVLF